ncbi:MAG: hypothetical protein IKX21_07285, partial [Deltaproteobacteria bacterium]|nr:hypothetical protein [Deltaproteobacteria bacterium]
NVAFSFGEMRRFRSAKCGVFDRRNVEYFSMARSVSFTASILPKALPKRNHGHGPGLSVKSAISNGTKFKGSKNGKGAPHRGIISSTKNQRHGRDAMKDCGSSKFFVEALAVSAVSIHGATAPKQGN